MLQNTNPAIASSEKFVDIRDAKYGEVLRGISFTPGTTAVTPAPDLPVTTGGLLYNRRTQSYSQTITVLNNTSAAVSGPLSVVFKGLSAVGHPEQCNLHLFRLTRLAGCDLGYPSGARTVCNRERNLQRSFAGVCQLHNFRGGPIAC